MDSFSKWLEILKCKKQLTTRAVIINFLYKLFSQFGVADCIVSDNETQFTSKEFKDFCQTFVVEHVTIVLYHPRSNGQAEHFVYTFKRTLKKAKGTPTDSSLQTEYIKNQIDKIRDSVEDRQSRIAWQTINEVSKRKNTAKAKLKAVNQQERIKLWKQHFENLLGNPPKITHEPITRIISKQLDIKLGPFTQEELDSVLRKIKNRKAAGLDEISPEVWKTRQFDDILLRHCNAVYNQHPIDRWMKGCILPFPKKGDLGLAKNYRGITLTSIAAKIYNALLRNRIEPKIDNILRKNQNGFRRNRSTTSQILTIRRILEGVRAKNLQATLIFVDFTKAFDSIHRGKMEQILLAYGIPKETVAAITILYRNTKVKVRSPDGDTEYFDIVAGVLQGDTLAPYLFIICLDYVLITSIDKIKENGFELTKKRSRRYPAITITDADYADDSDTGKYTQPSRNTTA